MNQAEQFAIIQQTCKQVRQVLTREVANGFLITGGINYVDPATGGVQATANHEGVASDAALAAQMTANFINYGAFEAPVVELPMFPDFDPERHVQQGANIHGLGPDVGVGPNPDYVEPEHYALHLPNKIEAEIGPARRVRELEDEYAQQQDTHAYPTGTREPTMEQPRDIYATMAEQVESRRAAADPTKKLY